MREREIAEEKSRKLLRGKTEQFGTFLSEKNKSQKMNEAKIEKTVHKMLNKLEIKPMEDIVHEINDDERTDFDAFRRDFQERMAAAHKVKQQKEFKRKFGIKPKYFQDPKEIKEKFRKFANECRNERETRQVKIDKME